MKNFRSLFFVLAICAGACSPAGSSSGSTPASLPTGKAKANDDTSDVAASRAETIADENDDAPLEKPALIPAAAQQEPFDIEALFQDHPAVEYMPTHDELDIAPLSSVPKSKRTEFLADALMGVNFGGRYRIIEQESNEEQSVVYLIDYKGKRGKGIDDLGGNKISDNLLYEKGSLALLEAYAEYPSGNCVMVGWVFNESTGEFESHGVRHFDARGCQIRNIGTKVSK